MISANPLGLGRWAAYCLLLGLTLGGLQSAYPQSFVRLSMDELVDKADHIFVARCVESETRVNGGVIITKYRLKMSENWKGNLKLSNSGEFEIEELGGEISEPIPVTQFVMGMANISMDEEVLLFAVPSKYEENGIKRDPRRKHLKDDNLYIVGRFQGRFTVFRHPETGEKLVSRIGPFSVPGSPVKSITRRLSELQNKSEALSQLTYQPRLKKMVDSRAAKSQAARDERAKHQPELANDIYQHEPLADVKRRVTGIIEKSKSKAAH